MQLLRDQIGQKVYPIHRLDKKTSGVLLFALDSDMNRKMQEVIQNFQAQKVYKAIVRGFFPEKITVNHPVINARGKEKEAITEFCLIAQSELNIPLGKHPTSRYSLIKAMPKTGRMHQIRRHLNHLRHPIIGDRPHGCSKQNRLFKEKWNMTSMMLHAESFTFVHPVSSVEVCIKARKSDEYSRMMEVLGLVDSN